MLKNGPLPTAVTPARPIAASAGKGWTKAEATATPTTGAMLARAAAP